MKKNLLMMVLVLSMVIVILQSATSNTNTFSEKRYMNLTTVGSTAGMPIIITITDNSTNESLEDVDTDIYLNFTKVFSTVTDNSGMGIFLPSVDGDYRIVADKSGYYTVDLMITVPFVSKNNSIIQTNTTWTLDNSPYYINGDILIEEGNKLTIEPDVRVLFPYYYTIYVDGTINITGNETNPVKLISVRSYQSGGTLYQSKIYLRSTSDTGENILSNCRIEYGGIEIASSSIDITNCTLINSIITLSGKNFPTKVSDNDFSGCTISAGSNTLFADNTVLVSSLSLSGNVSVKNNSISESLGVGISGSFMKVKNNRIFDNKGGGMSVSGSQSNVTNNLIYNNSDYGILVSGGFVEFNSIIENDVGIVLSSGTIRNNNLYNNSQYDAKTTSSFGNDQNLSNNYWGTANTSLIDQHIYDYYDDFELGKIIYEPILTVPVNITATTTTSTTTTSTTTSSTTTTIEICPLVGDYPLCGEVTLGELVDFINLWAQGEAYLSDVMDLINAWAG